MTLTKNQKIELILELQKVVKESKFNGYILINSIYEILSQILYKKSAYIVAKVTYARIINVYNLSDIEKKNIEIIGNDLLQKGLIIPNKKNAIKVSDKILNWRE